jgi:hypothetical protein
MGTGDDAHGAARIETDFHAIIHDAAELDIGRHGTAALQSAPFALSAPRGKTVPVGEREAAVHQLLEVPAVVVVMGGRMIGQLLGPDQIAPPQLDAVDAGDLGGAFHQPSIK